MIFGVGEITQDEKKKQSIINLPINMMNFLKLSSH